MINWEYKDYRPAGFECWEARMNSYYSITVTKLSDAGTRFTVRWYYKDMTDLKEHFDAKDWDEAKVTAVNIIRDYLERQANHWHSMTVGFASWTGVD